MTACFRMVSYENSLALCVCSLDDQISVTHAAEK